MHSPEAAPLAPLRRGNPNTPDTRPRVPSRRDHSDRSTWAEIQAAVSVVCEEISFVISEKYFIAACSVHICEWESAQHASYSCHSGDKNVTETRTAAPGTAVPE